MNPKISIIVPIYKVQKYLHKCINSILSQSFKDFELILVNDGSPDNCGEICEYYAKEDSRVKVIHKENGGLSSARNLGIDHAQSDYIAFVDSDDYIHNEMYKILYSVAIKHSSTLVICDYVEVIEGSGSNPITLPTNIDVENYTNSEALSQLCSINGIKYVIACNKLFKKELFRNLRFKVGKIHEDEFIAHEILFKCKKVTYCPVKLYFYLQRSDSITNSPVNIDKLDAIEASRERMEFFKKIKQTGLQKKTEYNYISLIFLYYFKIKKNVPNSDKKLMKIKKDFQSNLGVFLENPYFLKKEKICWFLFAMNPVLYELLILKKVDL